MTKRKTQAEVKARRISSPRGFGEAVHDRRKQSRATLREAAGLSGVGVRFLLELEHGKATASLGKALQVAERLGLEVWLIPRGQRPVGLEP